MLESESKLLKASWDHYSKDFLKSYLTVGLHDPRLHMQSVLTRHFLVEKIFGLDFKDLMQQEIVFAIEKEKLLKSGRDTGNLDEMQDLWRENLAKKSGKPIQVIELACGSANDYRFMHSYGLARFLHYKGLDLTYLNIENAREMFPEANFAVGNILDLTQPDQQYDYLFVHDLYEHLSLAALECALSNTSRLARKGIAIAFFNMSDEEEHFIVPTRKYHWNELSKSKIEAFFNSLGWKVRSIHLSSWLADHFEYYDFHNYKAYSFFLSKE